jgi:hypothetical protein
MTPSTYEKPIRQTVFLADLKCYMCGAVSGSIESGHPLTGPQASRPVTLRRPGESAPVQVPNWRRLRCTRCGGPLFLDESEVVTRRIDDYNWLEERPRRGRPPKRILEERRRERELLESQAA